MLAQIVLLGVAYLLGSFPTGYLVGRLRGIDIREHGSGSTGATNVWRTIGKPAGIFVFAIDLLKGLGSVLIMQVAVRTDNGLGAELFILGAAMLALVGHTKSIWLGFKGGKAVASGLGVLVGLNWLVAIAAFGIWLLTMLIWRTVSISSIGAAIATPILMLLCHAPTAYVGFTIIAGSYVVWLHRSNIERLRQGTEPKLFER